MKGHEGFGEIEGFLSNKELIERISPKFNELSVDIQEIIKQGTDPVVVAALLFKLVEERQKTNQLLEKLYQRFEEALKKTEQSSLDSQHQGNLLLANKLQITLLAEQDQLILHTVKEKGQVTAEEIRQEMGYKGNNAASQRLNKLYKEGYLGKIQAGRKVIFMAKNPTI